MPPCVARLSKTSPRDCQSIHPNGVALPKLHQATAYGETCQAYRARDQRGTAIGILPDREWERAAALRSANRTPNEGTGAEVPSHKLVDHRKDGARRSCGGNQFKRRKPTPDNLNVPFKR